MLESPATAPPEPTSASSPGVVLVADGVGGFHFCASALRRALRGGADVPEVRTHRWGHGLGRWHSDLTDAVNHRTQAEALAGLVRALREEVPDAPVFLVGKSGGCGVVVRALEMLPDASVERAVLLAPALSPEYDLTAALGAVRSEMVVFWSPLDLFVLGLGTRLFGTVDGPRCASAGLVGFRRPRGLSELGQARYSRLRQVRWSPSMASTGYLGGHAGPDSPAFLRRYVAPLLRASV